MRRFVTLLLSLSLVVGTFSTAFAASPQENRVERIGYEEIERELRKEGASHETIEKLIHKLKVGETWDSMNPQYNYIKPQIVTETYQKPFILMGQCLS
ncbi:hypothetical protein LQU94_03760 [Peptoniphilus sp. KCTC 25270]|uniref:hypothetical protein n=1 Tax=Peptoniphilus sp. KCTC 25270 TaxID=2897414 RepID=UPI001E322BCD|nr:hypothetical protein [Peptoniphilus sp. KCTC 25270]MCD1147232.1 hypothetical protein [Peptoniphilus sp. KCTC 25270]